MLSLVPMLHAATAACPGNVLFKDGFTSANAAFDVTPTAYSKVAIQSGKAEVTYLQANAWRAFEYGGTQYGDADVCVTAGTPATDKAQDQLAGIVFWGVNYASFYLFEIQPGNGQYAVYQMAPTSTASSWTLLVAWTANAAIVKGTGVTNALRVQTKGNTATLFVNNQQVGTVTGTPPSGGGVVGFYSQTSSTSASTWDFTNFSVSFP